ncbi:MAG: hypothetical protein GC165_13065 [Armatimonadetes bacterium]|nr:hypothetical protein [Armatimonadota bacterium]
MGTARNVSWSCSRQALLKRCPRAFAYNYYPWGEERQNTYIFLKNARTIPLLVGDIIHSFIAVTLHQYKKNGVLGPNPKEYAIQRFDTALSDSLALARKVKDGKNPGAGSVLMHHFNSGPSEELENAGRKAVSDGLDAFYQSPALQFLQTTDRKEWLDVNNSNSAVPYVDASAKLGLSECNGLRIYTPYDLALRHEGEFFFIDWKTGKFSASSYQSCRKQLTAYSLYALNSNIALESVRTVPYFLHSRPAWVAHEVNSNELDQIRTEIVNHHGQEMNMVHKMQDEHGSNVFFADFEDFQPKPVPHNCRLCSFLPICKAGKDVLGAQAQLPLEAA